MIRNPAYDGSSEEVDIAPLISNLTTPIVTATAREEDGVQDGVEFGDEDEYDKTGNKKLIIYSRCALSGGIDKAGLNISNTK